MPVKGVTLCGARCRTKNGAPCEGPAMKNGRCRMHGGTLSKRATHGNTTVKAKAQRRQERAFLREMRQLNDELQ